MFVRDIEGLGRAERQPCHRAVLPVGNRPVNAVDMRDAVLRQLLREIARQKDRFLARNESVAAVHDDDHFLAQSVCDQVVGDDIEVALPDPAHFVFADPVLNVHHRIAFV